jgi:O-antigen/teichoic acid export membrane protein
MYSEKKDDKDLMHDVGEILKLALFPTFLVIAILRVVDDNKVALNYVNIIACSLAISTVVATTQTYFQGDHKKNNVLLNFHFINILFFGILFLLEFRKPFINASWSDFLSIFALGASLSNNTLARCMKCLFRRGEVLDSKSL